MIIVEHSELTKAGKEAGSLGSKVAEELLAAMNVLAKLSEDLIMFIPIMLWGLFTRILRLLRIRRHFAPVASSPPSSSPTPPSPLKSGCPPVGGEKVVRTCSLDLCDMLV